MPSIEYLVISGAGPNGLGQLGILEILTEVKFLDTSSIKKTFGTSAGAIIAANIALGIDIKEMIEYIVERPWNKMIKIDLDNFLSLNQSKGLISSDLIKNAVIPFFKAYDIDTGITLKEAYQRTGIELNVITVEIGVFKDICLNHKTFPDLPLLTAVAMSSAMPPVFSPVEYEGKYYLDGGLLNNFPLNNLTHLLKPSHYDRVLAIRIDKKNKSECDNVDIGSLTGIEYAQYIFQRSFGLLGNGIEYGNSHERRIPYEIVCEVDHFIAEPVLWKDFNNSTLARKGMYKNGIMSVHKFLDRIDWAIKPAKSLDAYEAPEVTESSEAPGVTESAEAGEPSDAGELSEADELSEAAADDDHVEVDQAV